MGKILVTGATGNIGRLTLEKLIEKKVPAHQLIGLSRNSKGAEELSALGIEIRQGDYSDADSLLKAFDGVEKLMLVSATAFTDRKAAHANVVDAAVKAGVRHIVYMPIRRKDGSTFVLPEVTEEDTFTEKKIIDSGLEYSFVQHPPFLESLPGYIGDAATFKDGVRLPKGSGKVSFASRADLAEAHAVVLTEKGHAGKSYWLGGNPAVSFAEIASMLSKITDHNIPLIEIASDEYVERLGAAGVPTFAAKFLLAWMNGMTKGEWGDLGGDLERLIGRKPKTTADYLREVYSK
ncbi:MAG: NAD-dependent epimerase/dehydratase family protein [Proteobacteria bacterium]|nr:MAG: NAD-dependent epimerase/dehydratase family protein [Pseudomonadota bacterium]